MEIEINEQTSQGEFHLFPDLPPELRRMIILMVLPKRHYFSSDQKGLRCHITSVNREFRAVFTSVFTRLFDADVIDEQFKRYNLPLYAMLPYETLRLRTVDLEFLTGSRTWLHFLLPDALQKVKYVSYNFQSHQESTGGWIRYWSVVCRECLQLFVNLEVLFAYFPGSQKNRENLGKVLLKWRPDAKVVIVEDLHEVDDWLEGIRYQEAK